LMAAVGMRSTAHEHAGPSSVPVFFIAGVPGQRTVTHAADSAKRLAGEDKTAVSVRLPTRSGIESEEVEAVRLSRPPGHGCGNGQK
jgi:hypothetical protein